jgi:predicted PurR-regulated permease PerM
MYRSNRTSERVQRTSLVAIALGVSFIFIWMIWDFLMALFVAAILSGMFHPLYRRISRRLGRRESLASLATLCIVLGGVIVPTLGFLAIVTQQAMRLSTVARPWVEQNFTRITEFDYLLEKVPALAALKPYRDQISEKLGEFAGNIGSLAVSVATEAARQTANFLLMLFVVLYAMYFFLKDGRKVLDKMLYYLPLGPEDEARVVRQFVSVSRATIKGTLVIGLVQGVLGGLAFWVLGLDGAAFWGTVMAVLSTIPGLGHGLVWVPASIYLAATSQWAAAIGLFAWGAAVIGSIDNFLRPWLVGKDTELPDLMILVSTLGGLILFGAVGFVVGPIVAALFVTVWDLYGTEFEDVLPPAPEPPPSTIRAPTIPPPPEET